MGFAASLKGELCVRLIGLALVGGPIAVDDAGRYVASRRLKKRREIQKVFQSDNLLPPSESDNLMYVRRHGLFVRRCTSLARRTARRHLRTDVCVLTEEHSGNRFSMTHRQRKNLRLLESHCDISKVCMVRCRLLMRWPASTDES